MCVGGGRRGCHPGFGGPADLPCPPQDRSTIHPAHIHTYRQAHTLKSMANPLAQPVEGSSVLERSGIYTCVPVTVQASSFLTVSPRCQMASLLILTVFMVISNRCTCNLSSSVCLLFLFGSDTLSLLFFVCVRRLKRTENFMLSNSTC